MSGNSPTQNTLNKWRKLGYTCAVVEKWNHHTGTRSDLFGFIDVLCIGDNETVAIQTTSYKNTSSRIKKITQERHLELDNVRRAGWKVIVEGWKKKGNRWEARVIDLSLPEELGSPPAKPAVVTDGQLDFGLNVP